VRGGGTFVSVEAEDREVDRIIDTLDFHNPVDINERVSRWRERGWTGFDRSTDLGSDSPPASRHEEFASQPGPSPTRTSLEPDSPHTSGGTYPASTAEQMQTGTITNGGGKWSDDQSSQWQSSSNTTIQTNDSAWRSTQQSSPVSSYDTDFRNHYKANFATSGFDYERFEPAYRYGYTLATDPRYQGRDWSAIEPDARIYWTSQYSDSPWEKFKNAIRHGWEAVKQTVNA